MKRRPEPVAHVRRVSAPFGGVPRARCCLHLISRMRGPTAAWRGGAAPRSRVVW